MLNLIESFILGNNPDCVLAVAPMVIAAGISGLTNLVGGLFGANAKRAEEERQRKYEAEQKAFEAQRSGAKQLGVNTQNALGNLMNSYRDAFL